MAASARRRFYAGRLGLPFGLFFLDPRFPVFSGSGVLAAKTHREDFRIRDMAGGAVPFDEYLKVRRSGVWISVEDVPLNALARL